MDPRYARPSSPGGRRLAPPGRSSTGTLAYAPPYDPYYAPTRSSRDSFSGPRSSADRIAPPRIVTRNPDDITASKRAYDEYRPRRSTLDRDAASPRRPLSAVGSDSSNRSRPVIMSATDKSSSPLKPRLRDDDPYLMIPASSKRDHRRNYSLDTEDMDRLTTRDRSHRDRIDRGGYRSSGIGGGRNKYNLDQPLVRQPQGKDDRSYGYEYTDRREQMMRDTAPRPRARRESVTGARERPMSMTGMEDWASRAPQPARDPGPPVSTRGFDKLGRSGSLRQEYNANDSGSRDYPLARPRENSDALRRKVARPVVDLHQESRDIAYRDRFDDDYESSHHGSRKPDPPEKFNESRGYAVRPLPEDSRARDPEERSKRHHEKVPPLEDVRYRFPEERPRRHREKEPAIEDLRNRDPEERPKKTHEREPMIEDLSGRHPEERHTHHHDKGHRSHHDESEEGIRRSRDDEPSKEKHSNHHVAEGLGLGAAGIAAAGIAAHRHNADREVNGKDFVNERGQKYAAQDRAPRDAPIEAPNDPKYEGRSERLAVYPDPSESTSRSGDASDDERRERRRRRRKDREARETREAQEAETARTGYNPAMPIPNNVGTPKETSFEPAIDPEEMEAEDRTRRSRHHDEPLEHRSRHDSENEAEIPRSRRRHRKHHSHTKNDDSYDDDSSDEPYPENKVVRVVTPPQEKESAPIVKGILRPPREKFPEDPAPVREGVAPLKEAGKKGVPPNARWTKIDRKLVNPEALEERQERFEERPDYVIVLRVLTREEIEGFAKLTQEIRGERANLAEKDPSRF